MNTLLKCWIGLAGRLRARAVFVTLVAALSVWPCSDMGSTLRVTNATAASTNAAQAGAARAGTPKPDTPLPDTSLPDTSLADAALASRLDTVLHEALTQQKIVGAVVVAARNGQVVYQRAVGMADRENGTAMSLDTRFRLASMSKPIVSAAALALADQGLIGLDDPVTRWIPFFTPMFQGKVEPSITIRHLLTHTAGLSYGFLEPSDGPMALSEVSDGLDNPPITLDENIWRLASVPLYYEPGTGWRYSLAIDVLGEVVSRAGGDTLPAVVNKYVTAPLGMTATGFVADKPDMLAAAYVWADGKPRRMTETEVVPNGESVTRYEPGRALDAQAYPSGGAGMVGTAADYLKFLEAVRLDGGPVLKPETAKAMTSDQVCPILSQRLSVTAGKTNEVVAPGWGFGFGGAVLLHPEKAAYRAGAGTLSWSGAYGTHFFMDRENGVSFVVLTNTTPTGMAGPFATALAQAVYGQKADKKAGKK